MSGIGAGIVAIVAGIIGLAIVAVVVGRNAQTPAVLTSGGTALSNIIAAAVSPVTGGTSTFGSAIGGTGGL